MTTANFTTPRLNVSAFVTAAVAAWFVVASGTALADTVEPSVASSAQSRITITPEGTMRLTVVAVRPSAQVALTPQGSMKLTVVAVRPFAQVAMTPRGTMKLTVVAQRQQAARVHAAAVREASRG